MISVQIHAHGSACNRFDLRQRCSKPPRLAKLASLAGAAGYGFGVACASGSTMSRVRLARLQSPNSRRSVHRPALSWEQGEATDQELRIKFPVAPSTSVKDVEFKVQERFLRVGLAGQMPLLEGELWSAVDVQDTYFELEDCESSRFLVVYLAKCHVETWEEVLKPSWTWEPSGRHNEEICIYVPIGKDVNASELDFQLSYGRIRLACGNDAPLLEGDLWGQVDPTDCDWMIENHNGQRCVVISLGKLHVRENWDRLLKTEEGTGGWDTFQPGSRKDVDMAVLGSLEYVNTLLHQKDVQYARDYLDHILTPEHDEIENSVEET